MAEKAGFQIHADLAAFRKEMQQARQDIKNFNADAVKGATGVKSIEDATKKASVATQAFGSALGFLGAASISNVVAKIVSFGKETLSLARNLQAVENRAKALFGEAFADIEKRTQQLGDQFRRSATDILAMQTGFGLLLDSAGASQKQVAKFSEELTKLTLIIGKAFPAIGDDEIFRKLQAGIMGSANALRDMGIIMRGNDLEEFARAKNIKLKLNQMDTEQQMMLRIMYLTEQATKLQASANANTEQGIDVNKEFAATWNDIGEMVGGVVMPAINKSLLWVIETMKQGILIAKTFAFSLSNAMTLGGNERGLNALQGNAALTRANDALFAANNERQMREGKIDEMDKGFWSFRGQAAGGKSREDIAKEIQAAESKIVAALKEQADKNRENAKEVKRMLEIKQQIGLLTSAERKELDLINKRIVEQKDRVQAVVDAWTNAKDKVAELFQSVRDINQEIGEVEARRDEQLAAVTQGTADKKVEKLMDIIRELREVEKEIQDRGESLTNKTRWRELEGMIDPFRQSEEGNGLLREAERRLGMSSFDRIDEDEQKKRQEIENEAKKTLIKLQEELGEAEKKLASAVQMEAQERKNVAQALEEQKATIDRTYPAIEKATEDHVAKEVAQWMLLKSTLDSVAQSYSNAGARGATAPPAPGFATGGLVMGPGTGTSDSIPALLSNGEFVVKAAATRMYLPLLQKINSLSIPKFANGGPVTHHNEKTIHFNMHNHGDAASAFTNPRLAAFLVRTSF